MKKKVFLSLLIFSFFSLSLAKTAKLKGNFSLTKSVFAAVDPGDGGRSDPYSRENIEGKIVNPVLPTNLSTLTGASFISKLVRTGVSFIFVVGAVIFLFMLMTGAVRWISAGSDKTRLEGAQKQITHSLIGLALLFLIFAIIGIVERLFGVSLLNIRIPTL